MLWNWTTIDACKYRPYTAQDLKPDIYIGFLSSSWHITSRGMFAGSCIGVICLVLSLEFLRRVAREYDAFIVRRARLRAQYFTLPAASQTTSQSQSESQSPKQSTANVVASSSTAITSPDGAKGIPPCDVQAVRPTMVEQLVRAALHMLQFAVAYFVMLLAMYFNGYIIICIFIGAFLGSFLFSWEPLGLGKE